MFKVKFIEQIFSQRLQQLPMRKQHFNGGDQKWKGF